ncbi:MAG: O-methyltransferase [Candidatus Dormibacteraeota bacterium]|nr:O-methyltransferase [Candidatus Dormibacteraeota bacterium]
MSRSGGEPAQLWTDVDAHLAAMFADDDALQAALNASRAAGLPDIAVSAVQGKLLHIIARAAGARAILEVGTLGGYSAIWLARALPADGRLLTLEADAHHADVARQNIERAGLANVEVRVGVAQETMPALIASQEGPFDLVFIDADKDGYPNYLRWSLQLTHPGSLIIADNVVRQGKIIDDAANDPQVQGIQEFNRMLASEPRFSATVIQTVGIKGHDGLAFAVVL